MATHKSHRTDRSAAAGAARDQGIRAGQPRVLASYETRGATRHVVGQRIKGTVALIDMPAGDDGKVYLIEREVPSKADLDGIVADYASLAAELRRPPMESDWFLT